jgi:hypothetical protein
MAHYYAIVTNQHLVNYTLFAYLYIQELKNEVSNSRYVSMGFDDAINNYCVSPRI